MKKIILSLVFFIFFSYPSLVSAEVKNERWVCLNAEQCKGDDACTEVNEDLRNAHTAYISLSEDNTLLEDTETYIVEIINTDAGQAYTTGNSEADLDIYGLDNYSDLNESIGYEFYSMKTPDGETTLSNPFTSNSDGSLTPFIWHDFTPDGHTRQFLALQYFYTEEETDSEGGLQQGTFSFANALENCVAVKWDPYGRVFDAQTLEPILGATVTLSLKRTNGNFSTVTTSDVTGGNIINPQTVLEDGMFSFVVPDGTYKLSVVKAGYTFPLASVSGLNTNYSKIYSDIYPVSTGEEIVQKGKMQHRDIPVLTTGISTSTAPKLMEYSYKVDIVEGKVSHPFTIINAYSVKQATGSGTATRYRQLKQVQADKDGYFTVTLDTSTFEVNEGFGELEMIKTDLKTLVKNNWYQKIISFFDGLVKKAEAATNQTTTVKFDPILTYLEGYAYDTSGQILPNATVGIYPTYTNKPYYETKADANGYFKITSEHLPNILYRIRYSATTGTTVTTTTTKFISQNKKYLTEKKINLNVYKNKNGKILTKTELEATINPTGGSKNKNGNGKTSTGGGTSTGKETSATTALSSNNPMFIVAIILIVLIIITAIILGIYLVKKRQAGSSLPPTL